MKRQNVKITTPDAVLDGILTLPQAARGIVLFAHGSGSSRLSPRNGFVADELNRANIATLLLDLLTPEEDPDYQTRFDIELLTRRLMAATQWVTGETATNRLAIGYFGASTGAAAALWAAASSGSKVAAVVSRGGRPDLAPAEELQRVAAPTLLIVGGLDDVVIDLNRQALACLNCEKQLKIVPGATHLFEEPGTLQAVANDATEWFSRFLCV